MTTPKTVIILISLVIFVTIPAFTFADDAKVNETGNLSGQVNTSADDANLSVQNNSTNVSSEIQVTDKDASTGGIKNFMKSFKYQSGS